MSSLEELKSKFLVSDNLSEAKMLSLLQLAVEYCAVDPRGHVEIKSAGLTSRDKVMLVLTARFIAHALDDSIPAEVAGDDLVKNTGIAAEQVRARASDLARERQIEVTSRGVYRAMLHKVEPFLRGMKKTAT